MSAVIPKEIAQKIEDLQQTLSVTETSLHRIKSENAELKQTITDLNQTIIVLKARLYDLTTEHWY